MASAVELITPRSKREQMDDVDARMAGCHAGLERFSRHFRRLAAKISGATAPTELTGRDDESLVYHIADLRAKVAR